MDRIDRSILRILSEQGRITNHELADAAGLSPTACARRVRLLEERGLIAGYRAELGLAAFGLGATVMVSITLERQTEEAMAAFERAIARCSAVLWCYLMAGSDDYLACVAARDIADFERIHKEQLSRLPGVASLNSNFALRRIVGRAVPADLLDT
jgi:DNA-binding Lrp family transcriptional regulator